MSKAKGGTGRGTGSKGWTRWNKSAKAKTVGKRTGASIGPGAYDKDGKKIDGTTKSASVVKGVAVVKNNRVVIEEKK
ncbi:MAG: DUF3934 family protein [Gorillibacterium sp.]|nr:DUF3934 family protein [Gorillibacterium sp.]